MPKLVTVDPTLVQLSRSKNRRLFHTRLLEASKALLDQQKHHRCDRDPDAPLDVDEDQAAAAAGKTLRTLPSPTRAASWPINASLRS